MIMHNPFCNLATTHCYQSAICLRNKSNMVWSVIEPNC